MNNLTENQIFNKKATHAIAKQLGNFEVIEGSNPYHWQGTIKVNNYLELMLDFGHKNKVEATLLFSRSIRKVYPDIYWNFDKHEAIGFGKLRDAHLQAASITTRLLVPYMDSLTEYVVGMIDKEEKRIARLQSRTDFLNAQGFTKWGDRAFEYEIPDLISMEVMSDSNKIEINVDNDVDYESLIKKLVEVINAHN